MQSTAVVSHELTHPQVGIVPVGREKISREDKLFHIHRVEIRVIRVEQTVPVLAAQTTHLWGVLF